jgi:5'-deoxynucleotidase YfbR-like HD superfamily hydrolase
LACKEGFEPTEGGKDHFLVQKHFQDYEAEDTVHAEIARELDLLRTYRKEADYEDEFGVQKPRSKAFWAIQLATSIFEKLDSVVAAGHGADS